MSLLVIRLGEYADGHPSGVEDMYLVDFNPSTASLKVSDDIGQAKGFLQVEAALEYWRQPIGTRGDGEPDRPLTAFNVCIERMP